MNGHKSGVILKVSGYYQTDIILKWQTTLTAETILGWKDIKETTEYGATAIALLLMLELGDCNFAERLPQGGIGDYFLKKEVLSNNQAKNEIFLEISGIFKESKQNSINIRINQKKKQLAKKSTNNLNVFIAIVEFTNPKAKIVKI